MILIIRKNSKVTGWFELSPFTMLTLLPLEPKVSAGRFLAPLL